MEPVRRFQRSGINAAGLSFDTFYRQRRCAEFISGNIYTYPSKASYGFNKTLWLIEIIWALFAFYLLNEWRDLNGEVRLRVDCRKLLRPQSTAQSPGGDAGILHFRKPQVHICTCQAHHVDIVQHVPYRIHMRWLSWPEVDRWWWCSTLTRGLLSRRRDCVGTSVRSHWIFSTGCHNIFLQCFLASEARYFLTRRQDISAMFVAQNQNIFWWNIRMSGAVSCVVTRHGALL